MTGSCLCGAVRYRIRAPLQEIHHCHCSRCRKAHGAAFATYAGVAADTFAFTAGGRALLFGFRHQLRAMVLHRRGMAAADQAAAGGIDAGTDAAAHQHDQAEGHDDDLLLAALLRHAWTITGPTEGCLT